MGVYIPNRDEQGNPISETRNRFEREDIGLKLASVFGTFIGGQCILQLKVPGIPGSEKRLTANGYAFSDNWMMGDRCKYIELVDVDGIKGAGPNYIVNRFHDNEAEDDNAGWRMRPIEGGCGYVSVDPMGFYGALPSGLYLRVTFIAAASTSVAMCVRWGS